MFNQPNTLIEAASMFVAPGWDLESVLPVGDELVGCMEFVQTLGYTLHRWNAAMRYAVGYLSKVENNGSQEWLLVWVEKRLDTEKLEAGYAEVWEDVAIEDPNAGTFAAFALVPDPEAEAQWLARLAWCRKVELISEEKYQAELKRGFAARQAWFRKIDSISAEEFQDEQSKFRL